MDAGVLVNHEESVNAALNRALRKFRTFILIFAVLPMGAFAIYFDLNSDFSPAATVVYVEVERGIRMIEDEDGFSSQEFSIERYATFCMELPYPQAKDARDRWVVAPAGNRIREALDWSEVRFEFAVAHCAAFIEAG